MNPLCTLRYSATHVTKHRMVFRLDAYERKPVKHILTRATGPVVARRSAGAHSLAMSISLLFASQAWPKRLKRKIAKRMCNSKLSCVGELAPIFGTPLRGAPTAPSARPQLRRTSVWQQPKTGGKHGHGR
jgi:hypothetical protein